MVEPDKDMEIYKQRTHGPDYSSYEGLEKIYRENPESLSLKDLAATYKQEEFERLSNEYAEGRIEPESNEEKELDRLGEIRVIFNERFIQTPGNLLSRTFGEAATDNGGEQQDQGFKLRDLALEYFSGDEEVAEDDGKLKTWYEETAKAYGTDPNISWDVFVDEFKREMPWQTQEYRNSLKEWGYGIWEKIASNKDTPDPDKLTVAQYASSDLSTAEGMAAELANEQKLKEKGQLRSDTAEANVDLVKVPEGVDGGGNSSTFDESLTDLLNPALDEDPEKEPEVVDPDAKEPDDTASEGDSSVLSLNDFLDDSTPADSTAANEAEPPEEPEEIILAPELVKLSGARLNLRDAHFNLDYARARLKKEQEDRVKEMEFSKPGTIYSRSTTAPSNEELVRKYENYLNTALRDYETALLEYGKTVNNEDFNTKTEKLKEIFESADTKNDASLQEERLKEADELLGNIDPNTRQENIEPGLARRTFFSENPHPRALEPDEMVPAPAVTTEAHRSTDREISERPDRTHADFFAKTRPEYRRVAEMTDGEKKFYLFMYRQKKGSDFIKHAFVITPDGDGWRLGKDVKDPITENKSTDVMMEETIADLKENLPRGVNGVDSSSIVDFEASGVNVILEEANERFKKFRAERKAREEAGVDNPRAAASGDSREREDRKKYYEITPQGWLDAKPNERAVIKEVDKNNRIIHSFYQFERVGKNGVRIHSFTLTEPGDKEAGKKPRYRKHSFFEIEDSNKLGGEVLAKLKQLKAKNNWQDFRWERGLTQEQLTEMLDGAEKIQAVKKTPFRDKRPFRKKRS